MFDCEKCHHKHCDENNPAPFKKWEISGVISSNTCLKPMISEFSYSALSYYIHYSNNILYASGGISDQPNSYVEAMEIIQEAIKENGG